jgi:hypothetical protein
MGQGRGHRQLSVDEDHGHGRAARQHPAGNERHRPHHQGCAYDDDTVTPFNIVVKACKERRWQVFPKKHNIWLEDADGCAARTVVVLVALTAAAPTGQALAATRHSKQTFRGKAQACGRRRTTGEANARTFLPRAARPARADDDAQPQRATSPADTAAANTGSVEGTHRPHDMHDAVAREPWHCTRQVTPATASSPSTFCV